MGIVTGYLSQLVSSGIKLLNNGTAVSSSNPLPVVSKKSKRVSVTGLTVTNGAYSAKDVVGGLMTFAGALTNGVDTGLLQSITANVKSAQTGVFVLHLFKSQPSSIADNAVFALSSADALSGLAVTTFGSGGTLYFSGSGTSGRRTSLTVKT